MGGFWPIDLVRCGIPASCIAWFPPAFRRIQDCTHLMLMLGLVFGVFLIVTDAFKLFKLECHSKAFCAGEILDVVFLLPCTWQIVSMMGHYDDRKQSRLKEVAHMKSELTQAYTDMISGMNGLLDRAAESSAGLAEKNFAAHRRDFIHFLERCLKKFETEFEGKPVEATKFLEHFRRLLRHWLKAFSEVTIDPEAAPLTIERFPNEFDLYNSMRTLVLEVCDRLRAAELKTVTVRQTEDQDAVNVFKESLEGHIRNSSNLTVAVPGAVELQNSKAAELQRGLRELREIAQVPDEPSTCGWFSCKGGCGKLSQGGADGFPYKIGCGCCQIDFLCREHVQLLLGFIIAVLLALMNILWPLLDKTLKWEVALFQASPLVIYAMSLLVLVAHIEGISELLRLERDVAQMKEEHKRVEQVQTEMHNFWDKVQDVTDLWLYRTIPRLDLYKEMNLYLENVDKDQICFQLEKVNKRIDQLDKKVGTVEWWHEKMLTNSSGAAQKRLGDGVSEVIRSSGTATLDSLLMKLDEELKQGGAFSNLSPTTPHVAITMGSSGGAGSSFTAHTSSLKGSTVELQSLSQSAR